MDEIFIQLEEWSKQDDRYSIRDFAKEVGISYKMILELYKENEDWRHEIEMARCRLSCHAHDAINSKKKTFTGGVRYLYENDYELQDFIREEGGEVPEDPDEFDEWVEEQIKRDKARWHL